jgi:hypothetical protein
MASKKLMTLLIVALAIFAVGCSDDNPVTPNTADTAPPAVPSNLTADYGNNAATISWGANTVDQDLVGYLVTRENSGVTDTLVASPEMITSYADPAPKRGVSTYHVIAVDRAGNQSALASVTLTIVSGHETQDLSR